MRKHFLILMLMAILPLAGFAGDFTTATVTIPNPAYGATELSGITATLAPSAGGAYTAETVYYSDEACTQRVDDANGNALSLKNLPVNVGTDSWYWVKVTATGHTGFKAGKFQVTKASLVIKYDVTTTGSSASATETVNPLEVNYKATPNFTLTTSKIQISGWANGEGNTEITTSLTWEAAVKAALKCKYADETSVKNANWTKANGETGGDWINTTTKGYALEFYLDNLNSAVDLNNYEITWPTNQMKVYPISFVAAAANGFSYKVENGTYTVTKEVSGKNVYHFTYDGTAHTPGYEVKYAGTKLAQCADATATTGDFYVTYTWLASDGTPSTGSFNAEDASHAVKNAWAGYYKATINARANGNYYGTIAFPDFRYTSDKTTAPTGTAVPYYEIGKRDLDIMAVDQTKVYDGTAWDIATDFKFRATPLAAADAQVTWTGIEGKIVNVAASSEPATAFNKNVGEWEVYPALTLGGTLPAVISNNYSYTEANFGHASMSITPRPVTVTAKPQTDQLGAANMFKPTTLNLGYEAADATSSEPAKQLYSTYVTIEAKGTDTGVAVATPGASASDTEFKAEIEDILTGFTLAFSEEVDQTVNNTWATGIQVVKVPTEVETGSSVTPYTGNYEITGVAGKYQINGKTITIFADPTEMTYGKNVLENLKYATSGLTGGAKFTPTKVEYAIYKADGTTAATPDENGVLPVNAANYLFKITNVEYDELPVGFDGVNIDGNNAVLTISKKQIYAIIPQAVTLSKGNTVVDLNTVARHTVKFLDSNAKNSTGAYTGKDALVGNDKISYWVNFVTSSSSTETNVTFQAAPNADKIQTIPSGATVQVEELTTAPTTTAAVTDQYFVIGNANANYAITPVAASLLDGASVLALNRTDENLLAKLAAANGKKYTVRMSGYTDSQKLLAGKWYSVVLPFEISVAKLSATMKPVSTTADLNPAGYAIVNVINETKTEVNNVHFKLEMNNIPANTPFLVKPATDVVLNFKDAGTAGTAEAGDNFVQFENVTIVAPEDNVVKTVNGVDFTGVYKQGYLPTGASLYSGKYFTMPDDSHTIDAFASYWLAAPGARVFVEDLENGTTVIREISTESMEAVAADGWYTINGIKLQGVPTEKGIYINNGKKVVIK